MRWVLALGLLLLGGCGSDEGAASRTTSSTIDDRISALIRAEGLRGSPALAEPTLTAAQREIRALRRELGRQLFFDHTLGGIEQTSCATCHHGAFQFADGRNIARGVFCDLVAEDRIICRDAPPPGSRGNVVGPARSSPLNSRNTPTLINSALYPKQMWNGRFHFVDESSTDVNECDPALGFQFPPPEKVLAVRSLPTAQAHIPVTEVVEMTGDFPHPGDRLEEAEHRNPEVRAALALRFSTMTAYRTLFEQAYPAGAADSKLFEGDPEVPAELPIPFLAIADALGHFQESLIMTDAPWDRYVRGDRQAIGESAKRGALVFYTDRRCSSCHSGDLFSDFENYNIGVPQVGPGTAQRDPGDDRYLGLQSWDFGLEEVTNRRLDRFRFRTPPLRGVALTAPYMHNGAYATLEAAIMHHVDPRAAYERYDLGQIELDMQLAEGLKPLEPIFEDVRNPVVLGRAPGQRRIDLSEEDVSDLIAFLTALTDPRMLDTATLAPTTVPSGLPVDVVGQAAFPTYE
jgi:cytochrome c peroxidase